MLSQGTLHGSRRDAMASGDLPHTLSLAAFSPDGFMVED